MRRFGYVWTFRLVLMSNTYVVQVCFKFYYMAYGISYGYLHDCRSRVLEGRHTFVHGLMYEEDNRKISYKRETMVAWCKQYADEFGQHQPDKPEIHLSDGLTIEELWDEYLLSLGENEERKKSPSVTGTKFSRSIASLGSRFHR